MSAPLFCSTWLSRLVLLLLLLCSRSISWPINLSAVDDRPNHQSRTLFRTSNCSRGISIKIVCVVVDRIFETLKMIISSCNCLWVVKIERRREKKVKRELVKRAAKTLGKLLKRVDTQEEENKNKINWERPKYFSFLTFWRLGRFLKRRPIGHQIQTGDRDRPFFFPLWSLFFYYNSVQNQSFQVFHFSQASSSAFCASISSLTAHQHGRPSHEEANVLSGAHPCAFFSHKNSFISCNFVTGFFLNEVTKLGPRKKTCSLHSLAHTILHSDTDTDVFFVV